MLQTFRHGFPHQPCAMAFDPVQRLLAIGTKSGSLRMYPLSFIPEDVVVYDRTTHTDKAFDDDARENPGRYRNVHGDNENKIVACVISGCENYYYCLNFLVFRVMKFRKM